MESKAPSCHAATPPASTTMLATAAIPRRKRPRRLADTRDRCPWELVDRNASISSGGSVVSHRLGASEPTGAGRDCGTAAGDGAFSVDSVFRASGRAASGERREAPSGEGPVFRSGPVMALVLSRCSSRSRSRMRARPGRLQPPTVTFGRPRQILESECPAHQSRIQSPISECSKIMVSCMVSRCP
jgi:hypothetical protein